VAVSALILRLIARVLAGPGNAVQAVHTELRASRAAMAWCVRRPGPQVACAVSIPRGLVYSGDFPAVRSTGSARPWQPKLLVRLLREALGNSRG
jgi:hypothetical protein